MNEEKENDNKIDKENDNDFFLLKTKEENNNKDSLDQKLNEILHNRDYFNTKLTKLLSKDNYCIIIQIINNFDDENLINFINYLNQMKTPIIKILFNGFIDFDFDDELNNIILEILSKVIGYFFNKNIFYYIYKKLSKYYRKHKLLKEKDNNCIIKKFGKLFKVWKLMYNIEKINLYKINNPPSITLYTQKYTKSNNVEIKYGDSIKYKNNLFEIYLNFASSPIHNLNKFIDDFYFLKLENNEKEEFFIKYKDIFNENNAYSFSEVNSIIIFLEKKDYKVIINDKSLQIQTQFDFDSVSTIKILDYFYGQITSILVIKKNLSNNKQIVVEIKGNKEGSKAIYEIKPDNKQNLVLCHGSIFNSNYNFNSKWKRVEKELNEIEYFGGFNCFIPLFKIIKYFINNLKEKDLKKEIKDNNEYIIDNLKKVKDILKIMLKLICYSENNYNNLKKVIIPLICSLAEICESLNYLIDKKIIDKNIRDFFYKDEIIYILLIVIIMLEQPINIIKAYINLFEININGNYDVNNMNYEIDYLLIDITKNKNINIEWYISILSNFAIFNLFLPYAPEKITNILIGKYNQMIDYLSQKNIRTKNEEDALLGAINMINIINNLKRKDDDNANDIIIDFFIQNDTFFRYAVNLIKIYMNVKLLIKEKVINSIENFFMKKVFSKLSHKNKDTTKNFKDKKKEIKNTFKYYIKEFEFLKNLFSFLKIEDFEAKSILLMDELIDYNKIYHNLMKELFAFNRMWSKQKLFFNGSDNKISNLKFKIINYYTNNYQRPIIYPVLDYKYRYPDFSLFKSGISYYISERKDDYNFDLDCSNFDKIIREYEKKIFEEIAKEEKINIFKVCLVKQQYHVKGNLFIINENHQFIIYFYSRSYDFKTKSEIKTFCNKSQNNNENDLCYGSIFKSFDKEKNRKIIININDIRMILKRIFYYRKSAMEIFTTTKSYYFNFYSEQDLNNFFTILNSYLESSNKKLYFPIIINKNNNLGYIKINIDFISENALKKLKDNFIEFIEYISKEKQYNICIFDIIILINLISNRAYIDLNQYPVFPLLFFYEKGIEKKRKFEEHIGFQDSTERAQNRKENYLDYYILLENDINNRSCNILDDKEDEIHYFNVHYSNIVYVSNYMIRLFPYSFIAIELQGTGFDDPNRLFSSIEEAFFNMSSQKSDLRELIPEFFYLPEMFININYFHFKDKINEELVDFVTMPNLLNKYEKNINVELNEFDKDGFNVINANKNLIQNKEYKIFIFIDYMKKKLENLNGSNLGSWLNIIFGEGQKYKYKGKKKELLFRKHSYIDLDETTLINYTNNDIIMKCVEFGLIPLQTIYNTKIFNTFGINYEKIDENTKKRIEKIKYNLKAQQNNCEKQNLNNNGKEVDNYIEFKTKEEQIFYKNNLVFKVDNKDKLGKLELYINNILISEFFDHSDKIIDIYYNPRLNMFGSTSYDGFALIYIYPNKLISILKEPNNLYFDKIFLSSNPFPTIITFVKQKSQLISFSLSGITIKEKKLKKLEGIKIEPIFNVCGGTKIDRILVYDESFEFHKLYNLPFFDECILDK